MDTVPTTEPAEELLDLAVLWITSETRGSGPVSRRAADSLLATFPRVGELTPELRALALAQYAARPRPDTPPVRQPDGAFYITDRSW